MPGTRRQGISTRYKTRPNPEWCQNPDQKSLGLKLRGQISSPEGLATGLHKRVISQYFDKTKFALGVLARKEEQWAVPFYIQQGLEWLEKVVDREVKEEAEAAAEVITAEIVDPANHSDAIQ